MGATHRTDHYDLSQYQGSDKPSYLLDYNSDMAKIDAALYAASTTATEAGDKLHNEVEPTLESTKARSEQNSAELVTVKTDVQQNASNITMLTSRVNTIDNKTELLEDEKQNKALTSPVVIEGQTYATVEAAIAALAQYGGGDLNEYQKKQLSVPVIIEGTTYTTVEAAIAALSAGGGGGGGTGTVYLPGTEQSIRTVHTFDVDPSVTAYQYDNYTVPEDGYYCVSGNFIATTNGTINASLEASIYAGGSSLYVFVDESSGRNRSDHSKAFYVPKSSLVYAKTGQIIRLQVLCNAATGSVDYGRVEIGFTKGVAVNAGGGGDLSAYQTKVLSTPIEVEGIQYTTVESAMAAINALAAAGGGGGGTTNYNVLVNKPSINGVELTGNKTSADLHIEGGGTTNYNELSNQPQINGVTLSGNKTAADLGISGAAEYIRNSPTTSASSSHWNDWQGGGSSALSASWTMDNNGWGFAILRLARGSSVTFTLMAGGVDVSPELRYSYPQKEGVSTIDTNDYMDFVIPMGVYAKGATFGLNSIQGTPTASLFKLKFAEVDMT